MITFYVRVETAWMRQPIETLCGKLASWEDTRTMPENPLSKRWAPFQEAGPSEVKVGLEHKVSGPQGTYSSVSVRIEISGRCYQNQEDIRAATDVLYKECDRAIGHYLDPQHALLCQRARGVE